jgi:hypothetical protein
MHLTHPLKTSPFRVANLPHVLCTSTVYTFWLLAYFRNKTENETN